MNRSRFRLSHLFIFVASLLLILLVWNFFRNGSVSAEAQIPDHPEESTVLDQGDYLSSSTIDYINDVNRRWMDTDQQLMVMVYMTDHLPYDDLNGVANETFRKWKPGYSGTDNGVLVLIDMENRKFRIETSDKASTKVTDIQAKDILDQARTFFREQDYDGGVRYIVNAIGDTFYGTHTAQDDPSSSQEETNESEGRSNIWLYIIVAIIFFGVISQIDRGGGPGGGSNWFLWSLFMGGGGSSSGRGGSSGGFGSGGGFSGGGGGGGGASSGW